MNKNCAGIVAVPDAVYPVIEGEEAVAVHAKVVPATFDVSTTEVLADPEQIACDSGLFVSVGTGFTVIM